MFLQDENCKAAAHIYCLLLQQACMLIWLMFIVTAELSWLQYSALVGRVQELAGHDDLTPTVGQVGLYLVLP